MSLGRPFFGEGDDCPFNLDLIENEYYSFERLKSVISHTNNGEITVMVVNVDSLPKNIDYLQETLSFTKFSPDIIGLSETRITEKVNSYYHPHLPNYQYYPSPKSTTRAGSAGVFVKTSFVVTLRSDLDISVPGIFETLWFDIEHKSGGKKSTFGVVYRHCGDTDIPFFERKLESTLSKLNRENSEFYIFGDFNCDALRIDEFPNIKSFVDMMHSNSTVNLVNKPTRFPRGRQRGGPSLLDHFYTNQIQKIKNVGILDDDISDHLPVIVTIRMQSKKQPCYLSPYVRDFRNFDKNAFNEDIAKFKDTESLNLDARFHNLHLHISACINVHLPWRKRTNKEIKFAHKPWISRALQKSILERKRLFRLSRITHPNQSERKHKYNKYKKKLEKALFAAKCKFFSDKISEYQNKTKALWRIINEITKRKNKSKTMISKISLDNGRVVENPKDIANALNEYFVAVGPNLADKLPPSNIHFDSYLRNEDSPTGSFYLNPTNSTEILELIDSFSDSNCEAPDKITPKLYKLGAQQLSILLVNMVNKCFLQGYFPACLKIAKVTPIFKDGRFDQLENWRPISITCCTAKLIEKLVKKRLIPYLKTNNILNKYQFGYRSQHSTTHAILNISDNILKNFDGKKHTVSIFLDLSKGFDCVNHKILLKKLFHYGIRGLAHDFFKSYLTDRKQYTFINGVESEWLTVLCGVPQGSVLGPLLFLLYTNDLSYASNFSINLFADDTCLSLCHNNIYTLNRLCNLEAAKVDEWFKANRLTTNSKKASNFLLSEYTNNFCIPYSSFNIYMGNVLLRRVNIVKYLGVFLDHKVTWTHQIDNLSSKLARSAGIFSKLRYYLDVKTLIQMYHALFNSHLQYGILCWGSSSSTNLYRLQVLQNRAIRNMMKAPRFFRLDNYFLNLRLLKVENLYDLEIAKFMHAHHNNQLPECFNSFFRESGSNHNHYTRSVANISYDPLQCRTSRGQRSIRFYGPKVWNDIPLLVKQTSKIEFKRGFKSTIFSRY